MKFDWPAPTLSYRGFLTAFNKGRYDDGKVVLNFTRVTEANAYRMVAEADGPVRSAIFEQNSHCTLGQSEIGSGHVIWEVFEVNKKGQTIQYGAIGGKDTEIKPTVYGVYPGMTPRAYTAAKSVFLEWGVGYKLRDWGTGLVTDMIKADPYGDGDFVANGDELVWQTGSDAYGKIKARSLSGEVSDLVTFGNDFTKGAKRPYTDVWMEGEGRSGPNEPFSVVRIMTSPHTTDPKKLKPRRLRSDFGGAYTASGIASGFGYETHSTSDGNKMAFRITRLSDGVSWLLWNTSTWAMVEPLVFSPTEVFYKASRKLASDSMAQYVIVRIRLDSLGPGIPPD